MKEVWIPGLISIDFDDFTSPIERYIKHLRQCFISYPKTSNFAQNTPLRVVLSLFSVFGYSDEVLSLLSYMLLRGLLYFSQIKLRQAKWSGHWKSSKRVINEQRILFPSPQTKPLVLSLILFLINFDSHYFFHLTNEYHFF